MLFSLGRNGGRGRGGEEEEEEEESVFTIAWEAIRATVGDLVKEEKVQL